MTKRNQEHLTLSQVLESFIKENRLQTGIDKIEVRDAWMQLMGNGVANYTSDVKLKNETLYVSLTSSVLREELSYGKQKIITMLNENLGKDLIKELILR